MQIKLEGPLNETRFQDNLSLECYAIAKLML